jgi:hypothetical protein
VTSAASGVAATGVCYSETGADAEAEAGTAKVGSAALRGQMSPRGSPAISAAAVAPMIGPMTGEIPSMAAIIAPAYQPQ